MATKRIIQSFVVVAILFAPLASTDRAKAWGGCVSYGTSVYSLQVLNPTIYDPNLIYPGQVLRVW